MLQALNNCTITVNRRSKTTTGVLGSPTYSEAPIFTNISARIDFYSEKLQFNEQGERPVFVTKLFLDSSVVLQIEDQISNSIDSVVRKVIEVAPKFGASNQVYSYEVSLLDP